MEKSQPQSVAVNRSHEATTSSSQGQARASALPPYSGPSTEHSPQDDRRVDVQSGEQSGRGGKFASYPGLPRLDYRLYAPPLFRLSSDSTTITSKAEYLSTNATALIDLIRSMSTVPPKPIIRIRGTHDRGTDFDIRINLLNLLIPDDPHQRMDYLRCVGDNETAFRGGLKPDTKPHPGAGSLEEWCRRFTNDKANVKTFALERVVANLDTSWLEGQVRALISSTLNYRGALEVHFTTLHSRVLVQSPDRVNGLFTSVTALFTGKNKYEVVKAVWPFASTRSGEPGRRCAVQSEEVWWREWKAPIAHAVAARRVGWVSVEDKLEAIMEPKVLTPDSVIWGTATHR